MSTATTAVEVVSPSNFALALNQLSEEDRFVVLRLKQTYPANVLEPIFITSKSTDTLQWRPSSSPNRRSSASSTVWLSPSNDAESTTGSRCSTGPTTRPDQSVLRRVAALSRPISRGRSKSMPIEEEETEFKGLPKLEPNGGFKTLYFCTSCDEAFGEREDWKEHEWLSHERQYYWPCPMPKCDAVFTKDYLFQKHHVEAHSCKECEHAVEVQMPLPSKRAWACGFDQCKCVFDNWEERCVHVATHFDDLAKCDDTSQYPSEWKYTNVVRNLLRQPDIRDAYRRFMERCHGDDKFMWPNMQWEESNSVELKRKLDYRDFRGGVQEIARLAYELGLPKQPEEEKPTIEQPEQPAQLELPQQPQAIIITTAPDHKTDEKSRNRQAAVCPPPSPGFLGRIDKFPQPGTNPFDFYGPVPPSPIIQLDFIPDVDDKDVQAAQNHSTKSSISLTPYSLYPSQASPPPIPPVLSKPNSGFSSPDLNHSFSLPKDDVSQFQSPAAWATAYSMDNSPPRPKTSLGMFRSAKSSILRKKSAKDLRQGATTFDAYDSIITGKALPPLPPPTSVR